MDDICNWVVSQGKKFCADVWAEPSRSPGHVELGHPGALFGVADEVYEAKFGESLRCRNNK